MFSSESGISKVTGMLGLGKRLSGSEKSSVAERISGGRMDEVEEEEVEEVPGKQEVDALALG
jgi:hypothetical protein